jgi:hypothetical protein
MKRLVRVTFSIGHIIWWSDEARIPLLWQNGYIWSVLWRNGGDQSHSVTFVTKRACDQSHCGECALWRKTPCQTRVTKKIVTIWPDTGDICALDRLCSLWGDRRTVYLQFTAEEHPVGGDMSIFLLVGQSYVLRPWYELAICKVSFNLAPRHVSHVLVSARLDLDICWGASCITRQNQILQRSRSLDQASFPPAWSDDGLARVSSG